jgi:NAD(P)-dependent dehydrogenase (short-subunit alcohol dehydrogenase family)
VLLLSFALSWARHSQVGLAMTPLPSQRIVLVTDPPTGSAARWQALAAQGAHVIVHGRNVERGRAVVDQITASGTGSARFYQADFSSLADVRRLAADIRRDYDRLDLLINNAGIITQERRVSADGVEMQLAVNYLAGVQLTYALLPLLENGRAPRIVNVSSFCLTTSQTSLSATTHPAVRMAEQAAGDVHDGRGVEGPRIVVHALHPPTTWTPR